jgi:hypothetical protein
LTIPDVAGSERLLLADSCHWLPDEMNSRYAPESNRSTDVNFNNLKDCFRPIAALKIRHIAGIGQSQKYALKKKSRQ